MKTACRAQDIKPGQYIWLHPQALVRVIKVRQLRNYQTQITYQNAEGNQWYIECPNTKVWEVHQGENRK